MQNQSYYWIVLLVDLEFTCNKIYFKKYVYFYRYIAMYKSFFYVEKINKFIKKYVFNKILFQYAEYLNFTVESNTCRNRLVKIC